MDQELKELKQRRVELEKRFKRLPRILLGSLVVNRRICGTPTCKCARGEKHEILELSTKVNRVTKNTYIPWKKEKEARAMAKNYAQLWEIMKEISAVNLAILRYGIRKSKRKKGGKKK